MHIIQNKKEALKKQLLWNASENIRMIHVWGLLTFVESLRKFQNVLFLVTRGACQQTLTPQLISYQGWYYRSRVLVHLPFAANSPPSRLKWAAQRPPFPQTTHVSSERHQKSQPERGKVIIWQFWCYSYWTLQSLGLLDLGSGVLGEKRQVTVFAGRAHGETAVVGIEEVERHGNVRLENYWHSTWITMERVKQYETLFGLHLLVCCVFKYLSLWLLSFWLFVFSSFHRFDYSSFLLFVFSPF